MDNSRESFLKRSVNAGATEEAVMVFMHYIENADLPFAIDFVDQPSFHRKSDGHVVTVKTFRLKTIEELLPDLRQEFSGQDVIYFYTLSIAEIEEDGKKDKFFILRCGA